MTATIATGIYLLATVFGVGVTGMEMLGLLGDWGEGGDGGGNGGGDAGSGGDAGGDGSGGDGAYGEDGAGNLPTQGPRHNDNQRAGQALFTLVWYLRLTVYFTLGFGPIGLLAVLLDSGPWISLAWAIPTGVVTAVAARSFFRFQQREFDSSIGDSEYVGRRGVVTISIHPGEIGRVRIQFEQLVRDRYARSDGDAAKLRKGEHVVVTRVTDECVHVRPEADSASNSSTQLNA